MEENNSVLNSEPGTPDNPYPKEVLNISRYVQKIVLGDGTEIQDGRAVMNEYNGDLWVYLPLSQMTMAEAFLAFNDPSKTARIENWKTIDTQPDIFIGYTSFNLIKAYIGNQIAVRMLKNIE